MSRKTLSVLVLTTFIFSALSMSDIAVFAQEPVSEPEDQASNKSFKLLRDDASVAGDLDLGDEERAAWDPALSVGSIEVSLGIGFMNLNSTLLQHDQIIYKYNTDSTFWGDVELVGESAFAPTLRIGYGLTPWFTIESLSGISISQYAATIKNTYSRKNEENADVVGSPVMGEFDAEARSLITIQAGFNAVVYPLAINGDGKGRWHPYLTAGAGRMWYSMNSNYSNEATSSFDLNFGGGLRLLPDNRVSIRFEVVMHRNELEWTPAEYFLELNEGTTLVPLNEYPQDSDGIIHEGPVGKFAATTMNMLQWSIGVQGSF